MKRFLMFLVMTILCLVGGARGMDGVVSLTEPLQARKEVAVSGIIFLRTQMLTGLKDFYIDRVGCTLWLDQGSCLIFRAGNMLIGFCEGDEPDLNGVITFFYKNKKDVNTQYEKFKASAESPPKENKKYRIYHFYTRDPEGRSVEFQCFLHEIDWNFALFR